jgi:hypothetical protein
MPYPSPDAENASRLTAQAIATRILNKYAAILSDAERALVASKASKTTLNLHLTKLAALEGVLENRW